MSLINWFYVVPLRLRSIFKRRKADSDLDEELQYHLEMRTEENVSKGMNREEARRSALLALGGLDQRKEECRDARSISWIYELGRNFSYGLRIAWKQKALSLTVITLLAIACGVNITIFSFYNGLFLRPLPFPDCERLVDLDETAPRWNQESAYIDYTDFNEWRKENRSFDTIAVYNTPSRYYSRKSAGIYMDTLAISRSFLAIFRIQPVLGRGFLDDECRPGGLKAAMLGYGFWQREFGGSRSVLGEVIKLDGEAYTVAAPIRSQLHNMDPELPIIMNSTASEALGYSLRWRSLLSIIMMLIGISALLIAGIGIYGIVSYGVSRRTHEIGIRMAIGATRSQVLKMMLGGGIRLLIIGAVLGTVASLAVAQALQSELFGVTIFDTPTYCFVGGILAIVVVAASLLPARRAAIIDPMHALRSE